MDEQARNILTWSLLGILGPSIAFVGLAIWRMLQSFSRYGEAAATMRRRFLLEHVFLGGIGVCFFLVFEGVKPIGDESVRAFVFVAGFIVYFWTCGYSLLAWDLWSSGSGRRARRRPVAEEPADEAPVMTTLEAIAAPIPTIRIVHVFGDDPAPLAESRPTTSTAA